MDCDGLYVKCIPNRLMDFMKAWFPAGGIMGRQLDCEETSLIDGLMAS